MGVCVCVVYTNKGPICGVCAQMGIFIKLNLVYLTMCIVRIRVRAYVYVYAYKLGKRSPETGRVFVFERISEPLKFNQNRVI